MMSNLVCVFTYSRSMDPVPNFTVFMVWPYDFQPPSHIHTWPYDLHAVLAAVLFDSTKVWIRVAPSRGLFDLQQGNVSLQ